ARPAQIGVATDGPERTASGQRGPAVLAPCGSPGDHRAVAHRARRDPPGPHGCPGTHDELVQADSGDLTTQDRRPLDVERQDAHFKLRNSPTTRPSTRTSLLRIGSIVSFSGCKRTWSLSLK